MTSLTQENTGLEKVSNTNQPSQPTSDTKYRRWCLTLNNYTEDEYKDLTQICIEKHWLYIIGKEVGESGTPHLQCYISAKNPIRFDTLKNINARLHLEKAYAKHMQSANYCAKEGNYITNIKNIIRDTTVDILNAEYKNITWRPFQKDILDYIKSDPDKRKIKWVYESVGNTGKSFLMKYICLTNTGVIICDGKKGDVLNQVLQLKLKGIDPTIIIVDIPRSAFDYLNYGAIEILKNGCIYSGKYEGGICCFKIPHVIIFSNSLPDMKQWSEDRYDICLASKT